jgi:hypothetical protein
MASINKCYESERFSEEVESYSLPLGEKEHKKIIVPNSNSSIAGVVQGKLIPIQSL